MSGLERKKEKKEQGARRVEEEGILDLKNERET